MKRFTSRYPVTTSLCILLVCIAGLLINGCSKKDRNEEQTIENISSTVPTSTFFNVPLSTDPLVAAIAASLRRQDVKGNIELQLSHHAGSPKWDKAMLSESSATNAGRAQTSVIDPEKMVLIPFVLEDKKQTTAMLKVKISSTDTSYELIYAGQYADFGFEKKEKGKWNALNMFHLFTRFDNAIFGHKKFMVKDKRILAGLGANEQENTTVELVGDKAVAAKLVMVPVCTDYDVCLKPCRAFKSETANRLSVCCAEWGTRSVCTLVWVDDGTPAPVGTPSPVPVPGTPIGGTPGSPTPIIDPCKTDPTISKFDPRCLELVDPGWLPLVPYTLTSNDRRIFDEIAREDAAADDVWNKNCQGTNRTGNVQWPGTMEHWIIMLDYVSRNPTVGEVEYQIPGSSLMGNKGYADIVNTFAREIFEIKPEGAAIAEGQTEVNRYVVQANIHCPPNPLTGISSVWVKGTNYQERILPSTRPTQNLKARLGADGVIAYEYKERTTDPLPIVVPQSVLDKLKRLVQKLKDNLNGFETAIAQYMNENPDLVSYLKGAAFTAAVAIVVGTIVEDFFTLGAGIADDWASFAMAYKIIRFAWKL